MVRSWMLRAEKGYGGGNRFLLALPLAKLL